MGFYESNDPTNSVKALKEVLKSNYWGWGLERGHRPLSNVTDVKI